MSSQCPVPDTFSGTVHIDMEHLVHSGALDVDLIDPEHRRARAILALSHRPVSTDVPVVMPRLATHVSLPPGHASESSLSSLTTSDELDSPDVPLALQLKQASLANNAIDMTEKRVGEHELQNEPSSEEVSLSSQLRARGAPPRPPLQRFLSKVQDGMPLSQDCGGDGSSRLRTHITSLIPDLLYFRSTPSREEIKAADKLWRDWAKTDRWKTKEALKEPLTASGVTLELFADEQQANWTGLRPPQGVRQVEVTTKSKRGRAGADANTRNKSTSYKRTAFVGERSGCFQLVNLWGAVGHPDDQIGPSADFVCGTVRDFNAAAKLTDQLRVVSKRIDHVIQCVDPAQHAELHKAREELRAQNPAYKLLSQLDPSHFHGRSLIFNRATPWHTDKRDKKFAWTPVLTTGKYTSGTFKVLNYNIEYLPGTLILLRGAVFPYQVSYSGDPHVCIVHLKHEYDGVGRHGEPRRAHQAARSAYLSQEP
ncbi:hypothetical protein AURDEDRAFT_163570 [Auricularia subglabra TFB-10046 SS5]|nr:hypothetical protein AURDEDRAFT_163570 [Auricularia subglabra TFB-10046 SS5]